MKYKFLIAIAMLLVVCYNGFAQQPATPGVQPAATGTCKIKGKLTDSATAQAVGYATVVLFKAPKDSVAGGGLTDDKGQFTIENLAPGEYHLKIEFMGYEPINKTGIIVNDKKPIANVGNIKLTGTSKALKDVAVTGTRKFMENHLDKLVYNVENDATSQGGVATDLLKKIPMVSVDIDGNVDLLGDPNVRIFINGKPSTMFDNNLAAALAAIPSSQIKTIEVITSPGAQYDAQGTGGIINIILKDSKEKGINGNLNLSGGSRYENGSANVHIKNGNLDINASAGGNIQLDTKTLTTYNRTTDSQVLNQDGYSAVHRSGYWAHTGFDWQATKTDDIDAGISFNNWGNTTTGMINQQQVDNYPYTDTNIIRNSNSFSRFKGEDWNANYRKKFGREGQEFDVHYQGSTYGNTSNFGQSQYYAANDSEFSGAKGDNFYLDNEESISLDYTRPFSKYAVLNVGVKGSFSDITSNSDYYNLVLPGNSYVVDPSQNDSFNFRRQIYAAYVSYTCKIDSNYDLKLGVRDEYTLTSFPQDTISVPGYNFITPSATISRKLRNNQTIKFSYSRRIQRPNFGQYNPFVNASDPTNLTTGNPNLGPQKVHSLELSYFKFYEQGSSILVTTYYRYSADDWQSYSNYYTAYKVGDTTYANTTVTNTINAATEQTYGINISGTWTATKELELRTNINAFDKYLVSDLPGSASTPNSLNYRVNLNATYKITKNLTAELYAGYNSARYEVQGKYPAFASYNIAVKQQLWNRKANLTFSTTDPFNKYTTQTTYISSVSGESFTSVSQRKYPYQMFSLSFGYKFGKMEFKDKKPEPSENENVPAEGNGGENK